MRSDLPPTDLSLSEGIDDNLRFLILEVRGQLERTERLLSDLQTSPDRRLQTKDDYIDNLKTVIQRKCFLLAGEVARDNRATVDLLKAIETVAVNLERIADFCENVVSQTQYVLEPEVLDREQFQPFFVAIQTALGLVERALFSRDIKLALRICRSEYEIDGLYKAVFDQLLEELKSGQRTQSLVTAIFIYRYFERMGDSLLNVGEAILSAYLGERIKIGQFEALEDSLESAQLGAEMATVQFLPVKETRSGSRIGRIVPSGDGRTSVIFKDGPTDKIRAERQGVLEWHAIRPGLVPKIYSFHEHGVNASILFEYLPGKNFEEIVLGGEAGELQAALRSICDVLGDVWKRTRLDEPVPARFLDQLRDRLPDIYQVHPEFARPGAGIGTMHVLSFEESLEALSSVEHALAAPFSVFAHGDFNADNVIYEPGSGGVHFIDVHRSKRMDYVQDISVFLVSSFRLPVFDEAARRRIGSTIRTFLEFAGEFANRSGDRYFQARLALGLARSFATSTRFVLDEEFSKTLFFRARYLVDLLRGVPEEDLDSFKIPREVLLD
ncbi:MAG: phosphotransferase [Candidatus Eisenbacteria bacterium]|nr:phosphotransferase [Candidatus Eisenbacteria bacterium]